MRYRTPGPILLILIFATIISPVVADPILYGDSTISSLSYTGTYAGSYTSSSGASVNRLVIYSVEDIHGPFTLVNNREGIIGTLPSVDSFTSDVTLIDVDTGTLMGSGEYGFNKKFNSNGDVIGCIYWIDVDEWTPGTLTGKRQITISGASYYLYTYVYGNGVTAANPIKFALEKTAQSERADQGEYILNYKEEWYNSIEVVQTGSLPIGNTSRITLTRVINDTSYGSTLKIWDDAGLSYYSGYDTIDFTYNATSEPIYTAVYSSIFDTWYNATWFTAEPTPTPTPTTIPPSDDFALSLSADTAAVGDPITATLTNIPTESSRLILNVNGIIHRDITNPYNFSAIGNSGETIYVFANCYDSSNNLLYSSNVVSYTLTGELEPIEPYPELETVEITGVAPSYTQGNTLSAALDDNDIIGINEIWWKIIAQTDSNGNPSTITSKRYEFKEITSGNWQLKSGSSYTGSYTYANVKNLSHYIDGYGRFDVEVNCYNSTNGLVAIDRVNSYANPASYIKPVSVYIYGNSGLYSGEITLTTEYIVQSKNTTYYIYNGYETINVVKAGDYNIYVDLTDNSVYKDKVLQYSYDSDGSILRIYLEEDYTVSEHAKLSVRVVDSSNNPLSFANVHFIGLAESSITTNANGYAEYIGINNETVKFTASKSGYLTGEGSIKLSEGINTFTLVLPLLTDTLTPTVTPTTPSSTSNPITNFINLIMSYGMNEEMAKLVLGLIISGGLFAIGVKFGDSVGAGLAGAVLGIIFSCALNLIPMWIIVAILLCAAAILASKLYGQG